MTDAELKEAFDAVNAAIDELFGLFGKLSPRQAAMRPQHLRDPGEDQCEVVGGRVMVKSPKTATP